MFTQEIELRLDRLESYLVNLLDGWDADPFPADARFGHRLHHGHAAGAVQEIGLDWRVVHHGLDEVGKRVDESVLVTEDVSRRPPMPHEGMRLRIRDDNVGKALAAGCALGVVKF